MSTWTRRGARFAAVSGLAIACLVGVAAPANAAPGSTSSFGLKAAGPVTAGPFAASSCNPGPCAPDDLANANVAGIVTTGLLETTATASGASSTVNNTTVTLTPLAKLTASVVKSSCSIDRKTGGVSGDASIAEGVITIVEGNPITLESSAAPNTEVTALSPDIASVVLNRQTTGPDGTLTVDAIFITLLNGQTVTIASSSCTPTTEEIPIATGKGLVLGGGLLAVVVLGYLVTRRTVLARQGG